jgi:hypothetical protein
MCHLACSRPRYVHPRWRRRQPSVNRVGCHHIALSFAWILLGAWLGVLYVSRSTRELFGWGVDAQGEVQAGAPTARSSCALLDARGIRYE